ncbi:hypothetical protein MUDAN_BIHEEGNE_00607 [Lactiplantibacillus mudanjiangensis]|uniref:Uncharacterized protein n=1 Tax=Lactiplantibacillus mudanjiangensis TaxID=1296538 RepID=A0A660E333_9LACO|nr:hypothetical protein MUDAN_BIHEEGNE_00607 [Lactiplantibacillus mudanjiangensis]VDG24750.1 hypothetical protein MUDAN_IGPPGNFN_00782 [Lactiplantibacillus mudanjiangensis]VDG28502.1 hypothetical protein MUDAN_MDHGFNIF_00688 [Lactiplantibacillus mudanjiangensis]
MALTVKTSLVRKVLPDFTMWTTFETSGFS